MDKRFGEFIKEKRLTKGYRLKVFAGLVGISSVYESYIENGKRPAPTERILEKMAEALSLNPADRAILRRLAAATHASFALPGDISEYLSEREYLIDILRLAKETEMTDI